MSILYPKYKLAKSNTLMRKWENFVQKKNVAKFLIVSQAGMHLELISISGIPEQLKLDFPSFIFVWFPSLKCIQKHDTFIHKFSSDYSLNVCFFLTIGIEIVATNVSTISMMHQLNVWRSNFSVCSFLPFSIWLCPLCLYRLFKSMRRVQPWVTFY